MDMPVNFPVTMRSSPTPLIVGGTAFFTSAKPGSNETFASFASLGFGPDGGLLYSAGMAGVAGQGTWVTYNNAAARVQFDARL
jgi:hypothetical protein